MLKYALRRGLASAQVNARAANGIQQRGFSGIPSALQTLTEEEQMFKDTVAKFADDVIKPRVREMDASMKMDPEIIQGMFDNGLMGVEIGAEHGGSEASFLSAVLVIEELAKVDPSVSVCCDVQNTLVNNMFRFYANTHIQNKYLPKLATESIGAFGLSEAGSGSDAFALKTTATVNADGDYVLNGGKMWITNAGEADIFLVS
mmetsp:Transcript_39332/g.63858  ORF Transcript_39332/g.63858 Transcript_39332/m.63858 type:complete len:203 (+) Transcript_39332:174-782(+)